MTPVEVDYLDGEHTVTENEPSLKELVKTYGEEFVRKYCVDNLRYRNKHPRVYTKVSDEVAKTFPKVVVKEEVRKDKSVRKVYESEIDHLRRYEKEQGTKAKEHNSKLFNSIAPSEPLYIEGQRGAGKVSEKAVETANLFFAQGDDIVEEKVKFIEAYIPNYHVERDGDGNVTVEGLARGVQALNRYAVKQAQKQVIGVLGT